MKILLFCCIALGLLLPFAALGLAEGCCGSSANPEVLLYESTGAHAGEEYVIPLNQQKCAEQAGVWLPAWEPNTYTMKCVQKPTAEAPVQEVSTQKAKVNPPIIFIPNVEIPGLFGGPIQVGSDTIGQYIAAFYMFFVSIVGVLAVAMVVYGGYRRITSAGNASYIQESNDIINSALAGILLTFLSYLLINLINPTLTKLAGFELPSIKPILATQEAAEENLKGTPLPTEATVDESTGIVKNMRNIDAYDALLKEAAATYGLRPSVLKAIMYAESSGNPDAESIITKDGVRVQGACGLMQVMPANVGQTDCTGMRSPAIKATDSDEVKEAKTKIFKRNIDAGAKVFAAFNRKTCPKGKTSSNSGTKTYTCEPEKTQCLDGDYRYTIAAYNGGRVANCNSQSCPGKTFWECDKNWDANNPNSYLQTYNYVTKVIKFQNTILKNGWEPK